MAALLPVNAQVLYNQGGADLVALMALRNVNGGDTLDIATLPIAPAFQVVKLAIMLSASLDAAAIVNAVGTVVTVPAGLVKASLYLVISGC